jgi:excinuclease UvrABC nuclease subunit
MNRLFGGCLQLSPTQQVTEETVAQLPATKGVILFTDAADRPVQLLIAANIRRTASAKLLCCDPESNQKRPNITQIVRSIYYSVSYNDFANYRKYLQLAQSIYPDSWHSMVKLPKPTYVKIDLNAKWPFFSLTDKSLISKQRKVFGPFSRRKTAAKFIEILRDVFGLCQMPGLIDTPEKAKNCPYLQMQTCPGPCVGKISRAEYTRQIHNALEAAAGNIDAAEATLQKTMRQLSAEMAFEQAQRVKKQLDLLAMLKKDAYRWVTDLSALAILHIDRWAKISAHGKGKKIQTFSAFVITYGHIAEMPAFSLEQIERFYESLPGQLNKSWSCANRQPLPEQLSLPAYFLYRSKPPGIWLNCSKQKQLLSKASLLEAICRRFNIEHAKPSV